MILNKSLFSQIIKYKNTFKISMDVRFNKVYNNNKVKGFLKLKCPTS